MLDTEIVLPRWQCIRFCGHRWVGRSSIRPTFCPGCGNRNWYISPEEKPVRHRNGIIKRMYGKVRLVYPEHQGHDDECDCERPVIIGSDKQWWHLQDEIKEGDYLEVTVRKAR